MSFSSNAECKFCGKVFRTPYIEEGIFFSYSRRYWNHVQLGWEMVKHCTQEHPKELPKKIQKKIFFENCKGVVKYFLIDALLLLPKLTIALLGLSGELLKLLGEFIGQFLPSEF